jgi:hypothetical protein
MVLALTPLRAWAHAPAQVTVLVPVEDDIADAIELELADLPVQMVRSARPEPPEWEACLRVARTQAGERDAVAVLWWTRDDEHRLVLYAFDPRRDRVEARAIDVGSAVAGVQADALALVARGQVAALLKGHVAGSEATVVPVVPPAVVRTRSATPAPRRAAPRDRVRASLGYEVHRYGGPVPWAHGAALELDVAWTRGIRFGVGFVALPPMRIDHPRVALTLRRCPVVVHAAWRRRFRGWAMEGGVSAIDDVTVRDVHAQMAGVRAVAGAPRSVFGVRPRLRFELLPWPHVALFAAVGAEILLNPRAFVVADPAETLVRPARVRPSLRLGVAARF